MSLFDMSGKVAGITGSTRGIGRAQDLFTLDPDIVSSEPVTGSYERYLAG